MGGFFGREAAWEEEGQAQVRGLGLVGGEEGAAFGGGGFNGGFICWWDRELADRRVREALKIQDLDVYGTFYVHL